MEMVALVRLVQYLKAISPILVTLLGMMTSVNPAPKNADAPMLVMLSGIDTLFMFLHSKNTEFPIATIGNPYVVFGMFTKFDEPE